MIITSLANPRVKEAARLRDRRGREQQGRFLIDGARELDRALDARIELIDVFTCPELCKSDDARRVLERLGPAADARFSPDSRPAADARPTAARPTPARSQPAQPRQSPPPPAHASRGPTVWTVTPEVFEKLAFGERIEGVVATAATPRRSLSDLQLPADPLVLVLDGIEKPGNLGAILRSADGAGVSAVIVCGGTDPYNPNAVRASMGTVFALQVCSAPSLATLDFLRVRRMRIWTARVDAPLDYTDAPLTGPTAIVLGAEAQGLGDVWHGKDVSAVRLPMRGIADSLNVSVAAAVLCYEALRQRK